MQINVVDASYSYPDAKESIIKDISFSVPSKSLTAIIGASGSGKTTLAQLLAGLIKPQKGLIKIKLLEGFCNSYSKNYRHNVGIVFQFPEQQLFGDTVFNEIAFGPRNLDLLEVEITDRVKQAMLWMGLSPDLSQKNPLLLSGGEKRKIAIAGILALLPKVIVLDEPTAGLDYNGKQDLFAILRFINSTLGTTIIWITHDLDEVRLYSDYVCVMHQGGCLFEGSPFAIFHDSHLLQKAKLVLPPWYQLVNSLNEKCLKSKIPDSIQDVSKLTDFIISTIK